MNTLTLFGLEIFLCFGISLGVIRLIKPLLRDVLVEICGTPKRAEFWVMFTQLMLIISPLLIVIYFAPTDPITANNLVAVFKDTLFRTLLGTFIALALVGQIIWQSVGKSLSETVPMLSTEVK